MSYQVGFPLDTPWRRIQVMLCGGSDHQKHTEQRSVAEDVLQICRQILGNILPKTLKDSKNRLFLGMEELDAFNHQLLSWLKNNVVRGCDIPFTSSFSQKQSFTRGSHKVNYYRSQQLEISEHYSMWYVSKQDSVPRLFI